jgi:hypothetical protein
MSKKWEFKLDKKLLDEMKREAEAERDAAKEALDFAEMLAKLVKSASLGELTRDQLLELIVQQVIFTEDLRRVSNAAIAHANHLVGNYASDIPKGKMKDWAKAQVAASALLLHPPPVAPPRSWGAAARRRGKRR